MKHLAIILICSALVPTIHAAALTQAQQSYFQNRRICVGRDTTTLPGYVITTWHRNGRPDTKGPAVVTNRLQKIVGKEQSNPSRPTPRPRGRSARRRSARRRTSTRF